MPRIPFDRAVFYGSYLKMPIEKMKQAWDNLKAPERKLCEEWMMFREFTEASNLDVDPGSIEMCDPNAAKPPLPDIRCLLSGKQEYFELGEVVDESLAEAGSIARKNQEDVYGGFVDPPQVPFERMIIQKCGKRYTTNGCPLDLVLYFEQQFPIESLLNGYLDQSRNRLIRYIGESQFNSVWIYNNWQKQVLSRLGRS